MKIELGNLSKKCSCGKEHTLSVKDILIEHGAVKQLGTLLKNYTHPVIICDTNTKTAALPYAGEYFEKYEYIELSGSSIHADNHNVDLVQEKLTKAADILIAIGSGTIHDLTRYMAFDRKLPFISVPTAASVDGFVSTVAAMTWYGIKKTIPAQAPEYVLADTDIFGQAPYRLTASGISDLMGKYTALADWKIAQIVTDEYFCQTVYDLENEALKEVEALIKAQEKSGDAFMEKLMYALLLSGLAMQMVGNSRPASGAEHHISHLWEMEVINDPIDALHGEKVSVGLILALEKYKTIQASIEKGYCRVVDNKAYETQALQMSFGKAGLYEKILEENGENPLFEIDLKAFEYKLPAIARELAHLPEATDMKAFLALAGCRTEMTELGLSEDLADLTLKLSPYVRRRLTLIRLSKLLMY